MVQRPPVLVVRGLAQLPGEQRRLTRPARAGASAVLYEQPWPTFIAVWTEVVCTSTPVAGGDDNL